MYVNSSSYRPFNNCRHIRTLVKMLLSTSSSLSHLINTKILSSLYFMLLSSSSSSFSLSLLQVVVLLSYSTSLFYESVYNQIIYLFGIIIDRITSVDGFNWNKKNKRLPTNCICIWWLSYYRRWPRCAAFSVSSCSWLFVVALRRVATCYLCCCCCYLWSFRSIGVNHDTPAVIIVIMTRMILSSTCLQNRVKVKWKEVNALLFLLFLLPFSLLSCRIEWIVLCASSSSLPSLFFRYADPNTFHTDQ